MLQHLIYSPGGMKENKETDLPYMPYTIYGFALIPPNFPLDLEKLARKTKFRSLHKPSLQKI
jgi:hypothetical protein